jgi:hypothetical protein
MQALSVGALHVGADSPDGYFPELCRRKSLDPGQRDSAAIALRQVLRRAVQYALVDERYI